MRVRYRKTKGPETSERYDTKHGHSTPFPKAVCGVASARRRWDSRARRRTQFERRRLGPRRWLQSRRGATGARRIGTQYDQARCCADSSANACA
jgi:hypothetical protein